MGLKRNPEGAFVVSIELTWVELLLLLIMVKNLPDPYDTGNLILKLEQALQEVQKGADNEYQT